MSVFNSKKLKFGLLYIFIFIGAIFLIGFKYFSKPSVLLKYKDRAAVDPGQDLFTVFNPFRDKTPETEADKFLENLKNGNCGQLKYAFQVNCEYENDKENYALQSWNLIDREETDNQVTLHFQGFRISDSQNSYSNIWLTLQNDTGKWTIVDYEVWY